MSTDRDQESAANFDDVAFAYERGAELPDRDADVEPKDPDARGGAVLRGVDLDIPDGSFTVIMGASGGGKSTLVRCLNAIVPKHYRGNFRGDVNVLGQSASNSRIAEMARMTGMVMQDYEAQLFGTSIESEVAFGPENLNIPRDEIGDRIDHVLDLVDLGDMNRRRPPAGLSGGQKQRLVFASVIATYPELLILDEPTSDLDPRGTRELLTVIRRLMAPAEGTGEVGVPDWGGPETFVMVTHKIEEAVLADHVVLLRGGRVHKSGPARDIFTDVEALETSRVAVPPLVRAFDRLGVPQAELPIVPEEAREVVAESHLAWSPPGRRGADVSHPAGTGRELGDVLFETESLTKEYRTDRERIVAVDDVDMEIREGGFVAIVGHNGSGKTTLAKHLNGLLTAEQGTVRWQGRDVAEVPASEIGRHVGFVFQNPDHQLFEKTVREELEFGPKNFGLTGEELETHVQQAIETVELEQLVDSDPFNLSKGQRQRVALGSILAVDPDVIIFDEPTTGLDAPQARRFMDLVAELNREEDLTVVMVTHNMQSVARYAPRTVVLSEGRKVADVRTRELFADETRLEEWELAAPQQVRLSNRLAYDEGLKDALPALSIEELVTGLGGPGAYGNGAGDGPERAEGEGED